MITDELKLSLLQAAGVDNWHGYEDSIEIYCEQVGMDSDDLTDTMLLEALEAGGVDNWEGYDIAFEQLSDYEDYLDSLNKNDKKLSYYEFEVMNNL